MNESFHGNCFPLNRMYISFNEKCFSLNQMNKSFHEKCFPLNRKSISFNEKCFSLNQMDKSFHEKCFPLNRMNISFHKKGFWLNDMFISLNENFSGLNEIDFLLIDPRVAFNGKKLFISNNTFFLKIWQLTHRIAIFNMDLMRPPITSLLARFLPLFRFLI